MPNKRIGFAGLKNRRENALERLEKQLESGIKSIKDKGVISMCPLTPADVKRINQEIETLKKRV